MPRLGTGMPKAVAAAYVLVLLAGAWADLRTVYSALGVSPRAPNFELKRQLGAALAQAGLDPAAPADTLPPPWRATAELVARLTSAPAVRAVYDRYGASVAACSYCAEGSDYLLLAAVETAQVLVGFALVATCTTSLKGARGLRLYLLLIALVWTVAEMLGWADAPFAFVAVWTPYQQRALFQRLLLGVLAVAPLVLRDERHLTTKEHLYVLIGDAAAAVNRLDGMLRVRRAAQ